MKNNSEEQQVKFKKNQFKTPKTATTPADLLTYYKGCVFSPHGGPMIKGDPGSVLCQHCPFIKKQHLKFGAAPAYDQSNVPENSIMTKLLGPKPIQQNFNYP